MLALKVIIMLMPLPALYLVYARFFSRRPEFLKHAETLAAGIFLACVIYALSPVLEFLPGSSGAFGAGFVRAALVEKTGALFLLLLTLRYYPNMSVLECAIASAVFGVGFGTVENLAYIANFSDSLIIVRSLFSLPIHAATCGILGYYLGIRMLSKSRRQRILALAKGFLTAYCIHGLYDALLLSRSDFSYGAAPVLVGAVAFFEFLLSRAQSIPGRSVLNKSGLRFEDWHVIDEQTRYERWILQAMGRAAAGGGKIFIWEPGFLRLIAVFIFMMIAVWGITDSRAAAAVSAMALSPADGIMVFTVFPVSVSAILIIVGSINPEFFSRTRMKIPVIIDITLEFPGGDKEIFVSHSLTMHSCFIKSYEPFGIGTKIRFDLDGSGAIRAEGEVIWENHADKHFPCGSVIRITKSSASYMQYLARYWCLKIRKGFIYHLRLPGFESSIRLFMHPLATMQNDRFFPAGSVIFNEGDDARQFYILRKGHINLEKKHDHEIIVLGEITQGQLFGEMAVLPGRKRGSTALCSEDSIVAVSDRSNLAELIRHNPDFAFSMIQLLAERTEDTEEILLQYIELMEKRKKS